SVVGEVASVVSSAETSADAGSRDSTRVSGDGAGSDVPADSEDEVVPDSTDSVVDSGAALDSVDDSSAARTEASSAGEAAAACFAASTTFFSASGSGLPDADTSVVFVVTGGLLRRASRTCGLPSFSARPQFSQVSPP